MNLSVRGVIGPQTFEIIRSWGPKSVPEGSKWRSRGVKMGVPGGALGAQGEAQILGGKKELPRGHFLELFW